ncbi:endonuclease, Holliday junction resolvase [Alcanivorax hongdengensis A-11-3]|uniref:Putative pre-16S rRNA nuclease n=1 Tax=Alcanivorax hongdengensis A-11-3 TaxID=1177179 RepID=L0WB52_9GAMM|nr:Holliday junction resolvase RuvX [Alcanivorax hongdengensis]EKF72935.1 endonuclease, Holliday junction resolvase [Alcanivorax hongdengensis A-11-3]
MLLAFDYGTKKIGVASGNALLGSASPLPALPCKNVQPDWDKVTALIEEWQPEVLVVGLPLNMDGSESELCQRARKFARRLQGRFGKPVWMVDERLSTREARERTGIHHADPKVDSMAAVVIAEGYLGGSEPLAP